MTPPIDRLVVVGASAGGVDALKRVLGRLPADFPAPVLVVMHVGSRDSLLPALLTRACALPVRHARDGERLAPSTVLVAPPGRHMMVGREGAVGFVRLTSGAMENHTRPAIDPLFRSAAAAYGPGVTGVVLTGYLDDGTIGLRAIKACGGTAVVQDPVDAYAASMPSNAIEQVAVDHVVQLDDIADTLRTLAAAPPQPLEQDAAMESNRPDVPEWINVENRYTSGAGSLRELERIARPSTFTCPECNGTLWELTADADGKTDGMQRSRYRCHTGHSFTALALEQSQDIAVEESLWAAIRALNEKEELARRLAEHAAARGLHVAAAEYTERAEAARRAAAVLRSALVDGGGDL